jgi:hypothetical protein
MQLLSYVPTLYNVSSNPRQTGFELRCPVTQATVTQQYSGVYCRACGEPISLPARAEKALTAQQAGTSEAGGESQPVVFNLRCKACEKENFYGGKVGPASCARDHAAVAPKPQTDSNRERLESPAARRAMLIRNSLNPQSPEKLGTRQQTTRRAPILPESKSNRKIFSDYLFPADCFDSLYGEFLSNTRTR